MNRQKIAVNILLVVFIMIAIIIQVFLLNKHSTMGDQITLINEKIDETNKENDILSQQIASLSAMVTISARAKEYGLASSAQIISITTSLPLAANLKLSL